MPLMSGRGSAPSYASTKFIFRLVRQQHADHFDDLRPRLPFSRPVCVALANGPKDASTV